MGAGSSKTAAADKVAEVKRLAQAQRQAARRKTIVSWSVVGVVVAAAFAALVAFMVSSASDDGVTGQGQLAPSVAAKNDGIGVAASGVVGEGLGKAKLRVDLYLDPMCPICGDFEHYEADVLRKLREDGTVDVYYHPMNGLDYMSMNAQYSSRASASLVLVAQEDPTHFVAFVEALFAGQPEENTTGLDDAQIQDIARGAGVADEVVAKIPDHAYMEWVADATMRASAAGVGGYPTLAVDGVVQDPGADPNAINWGASESALHDGLVALAERKG